MKELHAVGLSGGKDSTAMALRLRELNPAIDYTYICTPTGDELPPMFEHWKHCGVLLGKPIIPIMYRSGLNGLIREKNALPNFRQRWCTQILKIQIFTTWLLQRLGEYDRVTTYVGIRADEDEREASDYQLPLLVNSTFPMREWGWCLPDVLGYLDSKGVSIPKRTDCARCFFQRIAEWHNLWREYPEIYADAVRQEQELGHTFRTPGKDTWPTALNDLAKEFESGRALPKERGLLHCRVCRM